MKKHRARPSEGGRLDEEAGSVKLFSKVTVNNTTGQSVGLTASSDSDDNDGSNSGGDDSDQRRHERTLAVNSLQPYRSPRSRKIPPRLTAPRPKLLHTASCL